MKYVDLSNFFNISANLNWTVCILPIIFCALFSVLLANDVKAGAESPKTSRPEVRKGSVSDDFDMAELEAARKETEMLRKEFADVLLKSEEVFNSYRRLQLSIASTVANSEKRNVTEEELGFLESFANIRQEMKLLVEKIIELSQFVGTALDKNDITGTDKIRLKFKLDDLKMTAEKLNSLVSPRESRDREDKCRILSVNDTLQIAILDAGSANGVNIGLTWRLAVKNSGPVKLKVIAVRPFICAAMILEGEFGSLAPGMQVSAGDK
jgi:hypothetical protein